MNKDWTKNLPSIMEDYSEPAPEGLWEAVSAASAPRKGIFTLVRRPVYAAALAAAAALLAVVLLWKPSSRDSSMEYAALPYTNPSVQTALLSASVPTPRTRIMRSAEPISELVAEPAPELTIVGDETMTPDIKEEEPTEESSVIQNPEKKPEPEGSVDIPVESPSPSSRFRLSFTRGGLMAQGKTTVTEGFGMRGGAAAPSPGGDAVRMLSRNRSSTTQDKQTQSARIAVMLSYGFLPRWSVESGAVLTTLNNTRVITSGSSLSSTEEEFSYIGIPLNLKYKVLEYKRLDVYLSAGPMYEKGYRHTVTEKAYIGDDLIGNTSGTDEGFKHIVWSVNTAAGVQYRLFRKGGLFVQPGISWRPGVAGSGVNNYYTAATFSLDVTAGIRLNLY